MLDFRDILANRKRLVAGLDSVQMSDKDRGDLIQLVGTRGGIYATRDKGQRVRGDTVYSCSKVGRYLTDHFGGIGPKDQMMWVGFLKPDANGLERWIMRPEIKSAIQSLGWV